MIPARLRAILRRARSLFPAHLLPRDRRAAVALMVGVNAPIMIGCAALIVDTGFWIIAQTRLQIAADAGAMGAGQLLLISSLKTNNDKTAFKPVALAEAQGAAASSLVGTFDPVNGITVTVAADWSSVTVVLTSTGPTFFAKIFNVTAGPTLRATAVASLQARASACVMMLGTSGIGIKVDNSGRIIASNCAIGTNSTANPSVYLDSGTISSTGTGSGIITPGQIGESNSGANTLTPTTATAGTNTNPVTTTITAPTTCDSSNTNASGGGVHYTYSPKMTNGQKQYVFCGNTTLGGNGSTFNFGPGTYYVVNGDLTFNNVDITAGNGVSFVMVTTAGYTGSSNFSWTNYSNNTSVLTGATTGPTAATGSTPAVPIWQSCNTAGPQPQTASFQGGSSLSVTGMVYMPCSQVDIGNNASVAGPSGSPFSFVGNSIYVHGSGSLTTTGGGTTSGTSVSSNPVRLTQ